MSTTYNTYKSRLFGKRADVPKNHLYSVGRGRLLYTSPRFLTERPFQSCSVHVLIALQDQPFELTAEGQTGYYRAAAVKPRVARTCHAQAGVNLQIEPSHPQFPRFRAIAATGVLAMNRNAFRKFDADFNLAYRGELSIDAAAALADDVLDVVLSHLPQIKPLDARVTRVIRLLKTNPRYPLRALAAEVRLSYYRLSHLFVQEMGISLRVFHLWRKVHTAMKLLGDTSIVEAARIAGFTDGSHLSHAFRQLHTRSPSYFFDGDDVKIIARPRRNQIFPRAQTPNS